MGPVMAISRNSRTMVVPMADVGRRYSTLKASSQRFPRLGAAPVAVGDWPGAESEGIVTGLLLWFEIKTLAESRTLPDSLSLGEARTELR